jgi:hypothetical protein
MKLLLSRFTNRWAEISDADSFSPWGFVRLFVRREYALLIIELPAYGDSYANVEA